MRRGIGWIAPIMAAVAVALAAPSAARAQSDCANDTTPVYTDACGPTFAVPGWGDAGGWTEPSKYSTIQLADLNGDGRDELLARNDQGLEIWWFDRGTGQWRPQVDANGVPQTLTDFRSPRPGETLATDWTQPQYYTTIQTAHIDGNPDAQVLARFADGMHVYVFSPGPGGSINGGRWSLVSSHGPFSDADGWNVPSRYSTIETGNVTESTSGTTDLIGRASGGLVAYAWNGSGWTAQPPGNTGPSRWFDDASCSLPSCWLLFRTAHLGGSGETLVSRPGGSQLEALQYDSGAQSWDAAGVSGQAFSDVPGRGSDCPFPGTSDCLGSSPSYYETLGTADVNGDGVDEVFARAADGLRVKSAGLTGGTTYDDQGQGGQISFEGGGWTRAQNVPGAINGTETSSSQDGRVELTTDVGNVIQVIGPVGPGLGQFAVQLDPRSRQITWVNQSAPRRREQQVLYEAIVPSAADGDVRIISGGGTVTIDAMRTFPSQQRAFKPLPTLSALAGTASSLASSPGIWGSIRTGDINGDGADEVLALDGKALQAYSLQGNTWTELPTGSHPLTLTGDWLTKPEYYSTIRVGDVDGDGRADVVARGPFGIRTWFYNRRGTGGWERYLDQGYPTTPGGKGLALAQLDAQARGITAGAAHIRDVWTTANRPDMTVLTPLTTNLPAAAVGNCGNQGPVSFAPPVYASCVPPAGVNTAGFTAADWTAAVNEMLREAYDAQQAVAYFDQLDQIRSSVFESESGSLPAIGADLGLAGAAGNSTSFNLQSFFAGVLGVAASAAGAFEGGAGLSAELWIGSELISMLPSASETATSQFQTTYAGLLKKFATAQDEMKAALDYQSQQVRTDQGLLDLVGQLRPKTWQIDQIGIESAAREAFALETYQALLPTMYNRYVITGCVAQPPPPNTWTCSGLPSGSYVIGGGDNATSATFLGPPSANPCYTYYGPECGYASDPGTIPDDVAQNVWGAIPPRCNYQPGNDATVWTYGCPLGIPISEGIGADGQGWTFATETGNPVVGAVGDIPSPRAVSGVAYAHAASAPRPQPRFARLRARRAPCSVRSGSPGARSSATGCDSAARTSSSSECCSSTVAARSWPARAPAAGCIHSRSGACAAVSSPEDAPGRSCACSFAGSVRRDGCASTFVLTVCPSVTSARCAP